MQPRYTPDRLGFTYPFDDQTYVTDDMGNAKRVAHTLPDAYWQDADYDTQQNAIRP